MTLPDKMTLNTVRRSLVRAAVAGLFAASTSIAMGQPLGDRPIRIIAVGTPGATADILARVVADSLTKSLGQPVVVEPKPGAGGAVAMESFLRAPADGHTYLLSISSLVSELPYTFKPKYDPFTAIRPLVELGSMGAMLVGNVNLPPKNFQELVAYVKANKGRVNINPPKLL